MHYSPRILRIGGACFIAVVLVAGAYFVSGPGGWLGVIKTADAASSQELLRAYAAKDTDGDGLPDWEEALYGTDPANAHSVRADISDGDAVSQGLVEPKVRVATTTPTNPDSVPGTKAAPSTITDQFAQTLLTQYLSTRGSTPPTTDQIAAFVQNGVANLKQQSASPDAFAASDMKLSSATGEAALTAYLGAAEQAFAANTVASDQDELSYVSDAIGGDASALKKLKSISGAYKSIANALMKVPVPQTARTAHLKIAIALMHMSAIDADMASMDSDPLRALMGIGLYDTYASGLRDAFANLGKTIQAEGVSIPEGTAGFYIARTAGNAVMQATTTP